MTHKTHDFPSLLRPTPARPLLGQTALVVEDSRVAGEVLRMMLIRGGARARRADSLRAAHRHLTSWRPSAALIDPGLPDGSGLELISHLANAGPRIPALIAVSGDPAYEAPALAAGADVFLSKPLGQVDALHNAILSCLPPEARPKGLHLCTDVQVDPDPAALQDDLALAADLLAAPENPAALRYVLTFVLSVARSVRDAGLASAAERALTALDTGCPTDLPVAQLATQIHVRLIHDEPVQTARHA